jgi:hypothetical protein
MDLTLEQIFSSSLAPFSQKEESQQRREQTQLISNGQKCTLEEVRNAFLALGSLDDSLRKVYQESFNDPEVLRLLTCIANATVSISLPNNIATRRIRHWISKLVAVGSASLQGYAFQTTLDNVDGVYLTKSNQRPREREDIIHEYFVGAFGTNKVRERGVPNFSYLFGIFSCSLPVLSQNGRVLSWCTKRDNSGAYLLQEYIRGPTLKDMLPSLRTRQFMNYFTQILFALREAQEVGFTHYDLHTSNVLLRDVGETVAIEYTGANGSKKKLLTDTIATIIDYGYSHIEKNGKDYGFFAVPQGNVHPYKAFPLHDVFKLLCFSLYDMRQAGNRAYKRLLPLLSFFTQGDLDELIVNGRDSFYALPNNEETRKLTLDDFLDFVQSKMTLPLYTFVPESVRNISKSHNGKIEELEPVPSSSLFQSFVRKELGFSTNDSFVATECAKEKKKVENMVNTLTRLEKTLNMHMLDNSDARHVAEYFADYVGLFESIAQVADIMFTTSTYLLALSEMCEDAKFVERQEQEVQRMEDEVLGRAKSFLESLKKSAQQLPQTEQGRDIKKGLQYFQRFERLFA